MNLTGQDKHRGPFTWGPWKGTFQITYQTNGDDDDENGKHRYNVLRLIGFGWVFQVKLPCFIQPHIETVNASWDEETVKRMGRNWYHIVTARVYGFSLSNMGNGYDFFQIFHGRRTMDSSTDQSWCCHLPWKQWDHVRHCLYTPDGTLFYTEKKRGWDEFYQKMQECPRVHFGFEDYDGEMIIASCRIEEREWHRGEKWFRWLKYFYAPKIRRSLDLDFNAEVGPEKGSWKGGTIGHSTDMLPDETPLEAFVRYCGKPHTQKGREFRLRFIGPCGTTSTETPPCGERGRGVQRGGDPEMRRKDCPIARIRAVGDCHWLWKTTKWESNLRKVYFEKVIEELRESQEAKGKTLDDAREWVLLYQVLIRYDRYQLVERVNGDMKMLRHCFQWEKYREYQRVSRQKARAKKAADRQVSPA